MSPNHTSPHGSSGYEKRDTSVRGILIVTIISAVIIVASVVIVNEIFIATREQMVDEVLLKPESAALRELRARETAILSTYGVVDAEKGIYRIPIDQAMKLMANEAYSGSRQE